MITLQKAQNFTEEEIGRHGHGHARLSRMTTTCASASHAAQASCWERSSSYFPGVDGRRFQLSSRRQASTTTERASAR